MDNSPLRLPVWPWFLRQHNRHPQVCSSSKSSQVSLPEVSHQPVGAWVGPTAESFTLSSCPAISSWGKHSPLRLHNIPSSPGKLCGEPLSHGLDALVVKGIIDHAPEERAWQPSLRRLGLGVGEGRKEMTSWVAWTTPVMASRWSVYLYFTATQRRGGKVTCFAKVTLTWSDSCWAREPKAAKVRLGK